MSYQCPICDNLVDEAMPQCPYCGFKFVGSTQKFNPLDCFDSQNDACALDQPVRSSLSIPSVEQPVVQASMEVIRGPQTGVRFRISDKPLKIGRDPNSDIFLNDMTVSREHALIAPVGNCFQISDLNSFNGVWVDNKSVSKHLLAEGDIVQIGSFCLLFHER